MHLNRDKITNRDKVTFTMKIQDIILDDIEQGRLSLII